MQRKKGNSTILANGIMIGSAKHQAMRTESNADGVPGVDGGRIETRPRTYNAVKKTCTGLSQALRSTNSPCTCAALLPRKVGSKDFMYELDSRTGRSAILAVTDMEGQRGQSGSFESGILAKQVR